MTTTLTAPRPHRLHGARRPPGAGSASPGSNARCCSPGSRWSRCTCSTWRSPGPTHRCPACSRSSPSRPPGRWPSRTSRGRRGWCSASSIGLLSLGFGVVSHGLHVVNSGPDWTDVTGVGMIVGGLLLVAAGLTAIAAPRRAPRRPALGWRLAHGAGWLAAVPVFALLAVMPFAMALMATHAPRWAIQESSLGIAHQEVTIETADGRELSAWYVPSRNRTAVLLSHGSGGSRERVAAHVAHARPPRLRRARVRQPRQRRERGSLERAGLQRPARRRRRSAVADPAARRGPAADRRLRPSLGAEVLLEAAAREPRLRAVVADGPTRPKDAAASATGAPGADLGAVVLQAVAGSRACARRPR